jgi:two-component system, NtrC family, response regulator AtoC
MNYEAATTSSHLAAGVPEPAHTVLLVENDRAARATLEATLKDAGYIVHVADDMRSALQVLQREDVDLVLTELTPDDDGEALLEGIREVHRDIPTVVMTSIGSVTDAVALIRAGAADCLTKPLHTPALLDALRGVLWKWRPQRERRRAARLGGPHLRGIIGRSVPMRQLYKQIARVARTSAHVLITGETGVGKELVARAIHRASGREKFVPVNCSAIPAALLESELFGHVRGAFTGADRDRTGLFEEADKGTLLLDEIAELPLALQAKLLRVLQSGELRRVGDVDVRNVAVRVIAASHRDLAEAVEAGAFREDLFYRINVLRLEVPPLRQRAADIPLLAEAFLAALSAREHRPPKYFTPAALGYLIAYPWPGNVRQMQNLVERAAVFCDTRQIDVDDLPDEIRSTTAPSPRFEKLGQELTLAEVEREHILGVLERVGGNRSRAAEVLGLPRRTLYRRLEEYGAHRAPRQVSAATTPPATLTQPGHTVDPLPDA